MSGKNFHPESWHEARRAGIGGSDWAHVLNIEPWGCARMLVYKKRGIERDYPEVKTGEMDRGQMMEPLVGQIFCRDHDAEIMPTNVCHVADWEKRNKDGIIPQWWIGNLDSLVVPVRAFEAADGLGVGEWKTKGPQVLQKVIREGVDESEIAQCQHYMTRTGLLWAAHFCLDPLSFTHQHLTIIKHDQELETRMRRKGEEFWKLVENGPFPPQLEPDDARCQKCCWRDTCQGERMMYIGPPPAKDYTECKNAALSELIAEHNELHALIAECEELKAAKKYEIRELTGPGKWQAPTGERVCIAQRQRMVQDSEGIERDHPGLLAKYKKSSASWWDVRTYGAAK